MAAATEALARVGHAAPTAVDVAGDRAARKALIVKRVRQWSAVALLGIVWIAWMGGLIGWSLSY